MPEAIDYSARRGAIVPLLPKIHALMKESAALDRLGGLEPPENFVNWRQRVGAQLLDINRKWLFSMEIAGAEKRDVIGFLFYRYDAEKPDTLYVEDLLIAWAHHNDPAVLAGLLGKLENDPRAKSAAFFCGERIKAPADKELLASVGFKETFPDGWEPLGNLKEAISALKLRYTRS
jgi:hypothetical protein